MALGAIGEIPVKLKGKVYKTVARPGRPYMIWSRNLGNNERTGSTTRSTLVELRVKFTH